MKINRTLKLLSIAVSLLVGNAIAQSTSLPESALIAKGQKIAIAGDCTACHTTDKEKPFAGGLAFDMPMGKIISSNITPSKSHGIGSWTEEEFSNAVRAGVRADGSHLYPAMPYTEYAKVTDEDIKALYAYFMNAVKPVDESPEQKTELDFPFNIPGAMTMWNTMFLDSTTFKPDPKLTTLENRGKYLVDGLAHCSTCHTPRNSMLASDNNQYLAGGDVQGWYAPNITSDKVSGIGDWTNEEIVDYLKTGRVHNKAQAGGPMAEAVENSLQYLSDQDLQAIAAYLKTVPAIKDNAQQQPAFAATSQKQIDWLSFEPAPAKDNTSEDYRDTSSTDGAILYNTNCAACHGVNGQGSNDGYFPSLTKNTAVGSSNPANLVMAISEGVHRELSNGYVASMPAFSEKSQEIHDWLNNDQIAALANYVTEEFGYGNAQLTAEKVAKIQSGGDVPFLIKNAAWLFIIGFVVAFLIVIWILRKLFRRKKS